MTGPPCRTHGPGGGVTSSGGIDRPLIRGMTTGFSGGREALRNVDVAIGAAGRPGEYDRRGHVIDTNDIGAFLGLDVGKAEHHATAVTPTGKKAFDKRPPNSEPKLRELFTKLQASTAPCSWSSTSRPPSAPRPSQPPATWAARSPICQASRCGGLQTSVPERPRPMPAMPSSWPTPRGRCHIRSIDLGDETVAELEMIVGFDDDLAGEATPISNRLRGLLTQIHPHLERVLGPRIQHPVALRLLNQFGSPALIRKAGRRQLVSLMRPRAPRMAERLVVEDIFTTLDEQTVVVPGTDAAALIVPSLASSLQAVPDQRKLLATRTEELLEAHPLSKVLTSMPGIGVRTGARILLDVRDGSRFPPAPTSPPTPDLLLRPTVPARRSAANSPPAGETSSSNGPSSCPRWRP